MNMKYYLFALGIVLLFLLSTPVLAATYATYPDQASCASACPAGCAAVNNPKNGTYYQCSQETTTNTNQAACQAGCSVTCAAVTSSKSGTYYTCPASNGYVAPAAPTAPVCTGPNCGDINYVPLEPLPGFPTSGNVDLPTFLNALFKILFSIGALLAVGNMVVGGIAYMTSEVTEGKSNARQRMTGSLYGLLLLAGSYLILNTINPQLLNLSFNVQNSGANTTAPANTTPAVGGGVNSGSGGTNNNATGSTTYLNYCVPGRSLDYYPSISTTDQLNQCANTCSSAGGQFVQTASGSDSGGSYTTYSCK